MRNLTRLDLAHFGSTTGFGSQSNFRPMVFNCAKNLTLYRVTLNNGPDFPPVPSGIDGLTVWNGKVQTHTPAGAGLFGIDGERDVHPDRKAGVLIARNPIYRGTGSRSSTS